MADTITRYLKLKISSDLSADAKANLEKIDALGRVFSTNASSSALIQAIEDITIEPASPSIGGTGQNSGTLNLGSVDNKPTIIAYSSEFRLRSALKLPAGNTYYVAVGVAETTADKTLTIDVNDSNRTITFSHDGEVVTEDAVQTLTNKTVSGTFSGPLTGNVTGNVTGNLTGNVTGNVTGDVTGNVTGNLTGNVLGNVTGNLTGNVTGNVSGTASNITGILALVNGGTGNDGSDKATALLNLLPTSSGNQEKVLRLNTTGDGLEWYAASGTGTVTSVDLSMPAEFTVSNNPVVTTGTLTVTKASQSPNIIYASPNGTSGVPTFRSLVEADIPSLAQSKITNLVSDLSGKQATITGAASTITTSNLTVSRALQSDGNGKVEVSSVTATELGYLSGVTSALQTQLGSKYDTSNPAGYVDASGARSAVVTNSPAWTETTYAPSALAVANYVAASGGGAVAYTWSTGDGATKAITHSLNKATVSVSIYDENGEDILVDVIDRTSNNAVSLTSSIAPTGNWTVIIRP